MIHIQETPLFDRTIWGCDAVSGNFGFALFQDWRETWHCLYNLELEAHNFSGKHAAITHQNVKSIDMGNIK